MNKSKQNQIAKALNAIDDALDAALEGHPSADHYYGNRIRDECDRIWAIVEGKAKPKAPADTESGKASGQR